MPGCITHYIFAKDCFDKLDNNNLKNIIESISPKYNIDSSKIKKCMTRFIDNNLIVWSCV